MTIRKISAAILFIFYASNLLAAEESNRLHSRLGFEVSLLGDPFPALLGANISYNLYDFLRAKAGGGLSSDFDGNNWQTLGCGLRFFVPGWNLSPFGGVSIAHRWHQDTYTPNKSDEITYGYLSIGLEWLAQNGINVGAAISVPIARIVALPNFYLGWYF